MARYLMETEVHVYALAISASVLLSFYPFLIVMVSFCHNILRWPAAQQAIYLALNDFFARDAGEFFARNLQPWMVGNLGLTSIFLLLLTANGIFEPIEVALNRAWGVERNRSYFKNQLISLGLILVCGGLALLSLMFTAMSGRWLAAWAGTRADLLVWLRLLFFKLAALPFSILALFLIYWLLPNRRIDPRSVAPAAMVVGFALESLKYLNLLIWPLLKSKLEHEYSIFKYSVTIVLWSFIASMIVLAGAHWTATGERPRDPDGTDTGS
jgi:membrane protein